MELIILIIKLLVKAFDSNGEAERQRQQREAWERAQREQWAQQLQQVGQPPDAGWAPPPPPLPVPARNVRPVPLPPPLKNPLPFAPAQRTSAAASSVTGSRRPAAKVSAASATTIARWMRPGTLRSQFILTEILKPPLALRPPRE